MLKKPNLSAKRIAIDKTNASLIAIIAAAVFIVIFCSVAIKSLYGQLSYQSTVINKKEVTLKQVKKNMDEVTKLNLSYQEFAGLPENAIGGDPKGTGDRDGENARIILDALPSRYDFPALTTSLDKLLKSGGFKPTAISGTDDEVNQLANTSAVNPEVVEIPFSVEAEMGTSDGKRYLELYEKSIRPMHVQKLEVRSQSNTIRVLVVGKTYFQPEKKLNVTEEVVKK